MCFEHMPLLETLLDLDIDNCKHRQAHYLYIMTLRWPYHNFINVVCMKIVLFLK